MRIRNKELRTRRRRLERRGKEAIREAIAAKGKGKPATKAVKPEAAEPKATKKAPKATPAADAPAKPKRAPRKKAEPQAPAEGAE